MPQIVLIRHGQSEWNLQNQFTGWVDVKITAKGQEEARESGKKLKESGFDFDLAYSSVLTRTIQTLNLVLEEMDLLWIPTIKAWELNEKHYGALQGLNKDETAQKYGTDQVKLWRRSYTERPPVLEANSPLSSVNDKRYSNLNKTQIPLTESLEDTVKRVIPFWEKEILPKVLEGKKIIISAHGNSLRALVKHLENMSPEQILELEIPTGKPLIYELDNKAKVLSKRYL